MRLSGVINRKSLSSAEWRVQGPNCIRLHVHASTSSAQLAIDKRSKLKDDVKRAVANTKRGKNASGQQQKDILTKIQALEAENPTDRPAESPLLSGRWSLLYTGPGKEDDVDWEKRTGGVEGPVLAALRPLSANAVQSRGITQIIDAKGGSVENLAEFRVANFVNGYLNVAGLVSIAPSGFESSKRAGAAENEQQDAVRVDVKFTSFGLKLGVLPEIKFPLGWANPTGWVDTTYLDEDFRIGRGDKGSVFVTALQEKR